MNYGLIGVPCATRASSIPYWPTVCAFVTIATAHFDKAIRTIVLVSPFNTLSQKKKKKTPLVPSVVVSQSLDDSTSLLSTLLPHSGLQMSDAFAHLWHLSYKSLESHCLGPNTTITITSYKVTYELNGEQEY